VAVAVVGGSSKREYKQKMNAVGTAIADDSAALIDMDCGEGFDRATLGMLGAQVDLLKGVKDTGKPLVVVLIHGRAMSVNWVAENADAVLDAWYPGEQGGTAVAEVLFGRVNPAGRLPVSIPRHVGQLPVAYDKKPPERADYNYVDLPSSPLYRFGQGLSYTTFEYTDLRISPDAIAPDGETEACVKVTNTGEVDGDEVVQLYIRDESSSVMRPHKELKAFRRVHIKAGQTTEVRFTVGWNELCFCGPDMKDVVEPGEFAVMVGGNSEDVLAAKLNVR
jgi:beta-glucosidase